MSLRTAISNDDHNTIAIWVSSLWLSVFALFLIYPRLIGTSSIHPSRFDIVQIRFIEMFGYIFEISMFLLAILAYIGIKSLQSSNDSSTVNKTLFILIMASGIFLTITIFINNPLVPIITGVFTGLSIPFSIIAIGMNLLKINALGDLSEPLWAKGVKVIILLVPTLLVIALLVTISNYVIIFTCPPSYNPQSLCGSSGTISSILLWFGSPVVFLLLWVFEADLIPRVDSSSLG